MQPTGRVTITDVALAAGVSVATVSKVINGRYGVAATTVQRVQKVIDALGYESSIVARSMRSRRTNVIGVLVAEFEPFSTEILKGASSVIGSTGYELLAYSGGGSVEPQTGWERRYVSRLGGTLIDGAILVTPTVVDIATRFPVVAIDPHAGPGDLPTIDSDNLAGAIMATAHLTALGHRRIGFLAGRPDLESSRLRHRGYLEALTAAGIAVDEDLIRVGSYRRETSRFPAHQLLTLPDRPTAIFAANDLSALAVIDVAVDLGLRVPEDLSVIGFDNIPESALTTPPLTTVAQPLQQLGAEAVTLLVQIMDGADASGTHLTMPTELVRRGTTRAL